MSRGTSNTQLAIINKIKEKGCLNIFEVAKIYHNKRIPDDQKLPIPMGSFWTEVREILNINSIYRMMKSLENRGEVATLLHKRPMEWYHVTWEGDSITVTKIQSGHFANHLVRGKAILRSKGMVIEFTKEELLP